MIDRERFRGLLGQRAKDLSDREIDTVRNVFYALGFALLEWSEQYSEEALKERADKKRKKLKMC